MTSRAKCPSCGLVQWSPDDGLCRRCATPVDAAVSPEPAEAVPVAAPAVGAGRRLASLAAVAVVLLAVVLLGWPVLRTRLHLDGAYVARFEDSTGLISMILPEPSWCFLSLKRTDLRTHLAHTDELMDTVRGSFFLRAGRKGPPVAVVVFRIEGILGLPVQRVDDEDRVKWQHQRTASAIKALGGEYTPFSPGQATSTSPGEPPPLVKVEMIFDEPRPASFAMGRFSPLRVEGTARVPGGFFVWQDEGPYWVVTLVALEYSRTYYVHIVYPQDAAPSVGPVERLLREVEFTPKLG